MKPKREEGRHPASPYGYAVARKTVDRRQPFDKLRVKIQETEKRLSRKHESKKTPQLNRLRPSGMAFGFHPGRIFRTYGAGGVNIQRGKRKMFLDRINPSEIVACSEFHGASRISRIEEQRMYDRSKAHVKRL